MAWELVITSAPKGLKPGSSGFCPVLATRGIPPNLLERLEALSGYRHQEIGSGAGRNPVVLSHTIVRLGTESYHVLSRVADAGRDYSGRSNKLAYHLVVKPRECPPGGPAALLMAPGVMRDHWDGQVGWVDREVAVPSVVVQPQPCRSWAKVWGDAGWGGILASRVLSRPNDLLYLIYPDDLVMLQLFAESLALLPEALRWRVTFTTYDLGLADIAVCQWRACPASSSQAIAWRKSRGLEIWDLTRTREKAPATVAASAGREGKILERSGEREGSSPARASTAAQTTTVQTASGATAILPPSLPPVAPPADDGAYLVAAHQGPPPIKGHHTNFGRSRKFDRGFWLGFLAGMACMLFLTVGAALGIRFVPEGKILSGLTELITFGSGSQEGSGKESNSLIGKNGELDKKTPAGKNTPHSIAEKDNQISHGKAASSQGNRGKQGSAAHNTENNSEGSKLPNDSKNEGIRDKSSPTAAPGTSAANEDSQNEQARESSELKQAKTPADREAAWSPNRTPSPAPSSSTSQQREQPAAGDVQGDNLNHDLEEALLWTHCPIDSFSIYSVDPPRDHREKIPLVIDARPKYSVSRESAGERGIELFVVRYSDEAKLTQVYYRAPEGWPRKERIEANGQISIPSPPGPIPLQLKTVDSWKGQFPIYKYGNGDRDLITLTLEGKGGNIIIKTQLEKDAEEKLPESIIAKLGFWVKAPEVLPRALWVTMLELEIARSK